MSFAHLSLLLLLLLLPLLAGLKWWGDVRSRQVASRVASPRLLEGLLIGQGRGRSWLVLALELGALACFIVALARPQYGFVEEETGAGGRSLILAIDTSRSMLADDLKPSRMLRSQLAAADLVKRLRGDRIGLMPFAGTAYMYAPITPDVDALLESIDSLDTEIIPRGGSNLAKPIDLALETFAKSGATGQQVLILFSDGENLEGTTLDAAKRAKEKKMTIITIGVGTQAGALIPDPEAQGGFFRDREGKPVISRLQRDVLLSIANTTGGLYLPLDENGVNDRRIDLILEKLERTDMKGKTTRKSLDRYRWPLGAGLLLLLAAWLAGIVKRHTGTPSSARSGAAPPPLPPAALAALLFLGFCALPSSAEAAPPAGPAKAEREMPEGNPYTFYQEGDYEAALHNFSKRLTPEEPDLERQGGDPVLEFGRGAAAFKNKDYDMAADAFGSAVLANDLSLRAQAHYNLGNAIYQRSAVLAKQAKPKTLAKLSFIDGLIRQLENSLENYQQALILKPDEADFKANHDTADALIQKLRQLRKEMAEQQGQGKDGKKGKKKGKKGEGESPGQGKGEGDEESEETGKGPNGQKEAEGAGEKESDAEKAAREKSNEEKDGKIDEQGAKPGEKENEGEEKGKGEKEGAGEDGKKGEKDGKGGEGGKKGTESDPDEESDADNEVNPETGYSRGEAKRQLERLSDEDLKVRPRVETSRESRPLKDW